MISKKHVVLLRHREPKNLNTTYHCSSGSKPHKPPEMNHYSVSTHKEMQQTPHSYTHFGRYRRELTLLLLSSVGISLSPHRRELREPVQRFSCVKFPHPCSCLGFQGSPRNFDSPFALCGVIVKTRIPNLTGELRELAPSSLLKTQGGTLRSLGAIAEVLIIMSNHTTQKICVVSRQRL